MLDPDPDEINVDPQPCGSGSSGSGTLTVTVHHTWRRGTVPVGTQLTFSPSPAQRCVSSSSTRPSEKEKKTLFLNVHWDRFDHRNATQKQGIKSADSTFSAEYFGIRRFYKKAFAVLLIPVVSYTGNQCCGTGSRYVESVSFWASRIRIHHYLYGSSLIQCSHCKSYI